LVLTKKAAELISTTSFGVTKTPASDNAKRPTPLLLFGIGRRWVRPTRRRHRLTV